MTESDFSAWLASTNWAIGSCTSGGISSKQMTTILRVKTGVDVVVESKQ